MTAAQRLHPYYRQSGDGRARIVKIGDDSGVRYEVWKKHGVRFIQHRVNLSSFQEACQVALDDLCADFEAQS